MDEKQITVPHTLYIDNRSHLILQGVTDVHTFNEETVFLETSSGGLTVNGTNLQVTGLSLETGNVTIDGTIVSVIYSNGVKRNGGFFSKVFG